MAVKRKKSSRTARPAKAAGGKSKAARPAKAAKSARRAAAKPPARKHSPAKAAASKGPLPKPVALKPKATKTNAAPSGIVKSVEAALDDMKAVNVRVLDVRKLTDIADTMVIASGNSDRHVRSIAERVVEFAKRDGFRPTGVEGERDGEWVLVDLRDVIVHIMLPRIREFYRLEDLWDVSAARREAAGGEKG